MEYCGNKMLEQPSPFLMIRTAEERINSLRFKILVLETKGSNQMDRINQPTVWWMIFRNSYSEDAIESNKF